MADELCYFWRVYPTGNVFATLGHSVNGPGLSVEFQLPESLYLAVKECVERQLQEEIHKVVNSAKPGYARVKNG